MWIINNMDACNTSSQVISVDSSREWVEKVKTKNLYESRLIIKNIDLGELGSYGTFKLYQIS